LTISVHQLNLAKLTKEKYMFYVYVYRDPRPNKNIQPVYVGKGTGDRDLSHWSRGSHNKPFQDFLSHIKRKGLIAICTRVFESENEHEAFAKEIELITLYGRRDIGTGTLFNRTDGGEGASGFQKTEAQKETDRINTTNNWKNPEYAKKVYTAQKIAQNTPEAKRIKSKNSKALWREKGDEIKHSIVIARNTEESKAKTSKQAKAQWDDAEYREKQTANNKEIANREEVKAAKKAAAKALWADPEWRAKMMEARAKNKAEKQSK
jgi:hypothetical protein